MLRLLATAAATGLRLGTAVAQIEAAATNGRCRATGELCGGDRGCCCEHCRHGRCRCRGRGAAPTRPRKRPDRLIADKGCGYPRCRRVPIVPAGYRRRNVVERRVNRLEQRRSVATRHGRRAADSRAVVVIASLVIWLGS